MLTSFSDLLCHPNEVIRKVLSKTNKMRGQPSPGHILLTKYNDFGFWANLDDVSPVTSLCDVLQGIFGFFVILESLLVILPSSISNRAFPGIFRQNFPKIVVWGATSREGRVGPGFRPSSEVKKWTAPKTKFRREAKIS